MSSLYTDK